MLRDFHAAVSAAEAREEEYNSNVRNRCMKYMMLAGEVVNSV
jgi:hypothetical protein